MYLSPFPGHCPQFGKVGSWAEVLTPKVNPHTNFARVTCMMVAEVDPVVIRAFRIPIIPGAVVLFLVALAALAYAAVAHEALGFAGLPLSGWHGERKESTSLKEEGGWGQTCACACSHGCNVCGTLVFRHVFGSQKAHLCRCFSSPFMGSGG